MYYLKTDQFTSFLKYSVQFIYPPLLLYVIYAVEKNRKIGQQSLSQEKRYFLCWILFSVEKYWHFYRVFAERLNCVT
jgi:hypothetical protein